MNETPAHGSFSLRSVIVGVAEDAHSDQAVEAGLELSDRFGAALELVHGVEVAPVMWPDTDKAWIAERNAEAVSIAWKRSCARLRELYEQLGRQGDRVEEILRVLSGTPTQVLLREAEEVGADLLVLGAHRKRGLIDFGRTARAVLSASRRDVWVQPGPCRPIERILVPVDLSEDSGRALDKARGLARAFDAQLITLHCVTMPMLGTIPAATCPEAGMSNSVEQACDARRAEYERAMAELEWQGFVHRHEFREAPPIQAILELAGQADLIVMGTHGRTGLSAALLGNVAYGVLRRSRIPVLAVRHPDRSWLL